jgi:hypothetical protein
LANPPRRAGTLAEEEVSMAFPKGWRWARTAAASAVLLLAPTLLFAGGGEKQGKLVHVADTRNLKGFNLYFADLYNTNRLLFTVEVIAITALTGLLLGLLMDVLVSRIGIDLSHRDEKE